MPKSARSLAGLLLALAIGAAPVAADEPLGTTLARLDREIAAAPRDAMLWARRAEIERLIGRYESSLRSLERAAELGLDATLAGRERGATLLAAGRVVDAEAALRVARDAAPNDVGVLLAHARALARLGRSGDAADGYDRIVALAPRSNPDVYLERIHARAASGPDSVDAALAAVGDALGALGPVPAFEQAGLDLELRSGRIDAALARLDRMTNASPADAGLRLRRAEILERAGRIAEAGDAYRTVLSAVGDMPPARRTTPAAIRIEADARDGVARIALGREGRRP